MDEWIELIYIFIMCFVLYILFICYLENSKYKKSSYGKQKKESFWKTISDTGAKGEYRTSLALDKSSFYKKMIFNCYLPKNQNDTTEIDIIMLSTKGIFVIENKNYNGWIFGDEKSKNWCQTLHGQKNFFYNPIKQNSSHIKALLKLTNENQNNIFSLIVFNKATLKKVTYESNDNLTVINLAQLQNILKKHDKKRDIYSNDEVDSLYNKLLPYTEITIEKKEEHIRRIKSKQMNT